MKKLLLLLCVPLIFSCGEDNGSKKKDRKDAEHETTNATENGKEAGKLMCKIGELKEEIEDLQADILKLDWDDDDEREEIADLEKDKFKLEVKAHKLMVKMKKLENKKWLATEHEDDLKEWDEDFQQEMKDYIEDNCMPKRY